MSYVSQLRAVLRGGDFRRLFAVRLTSQLSDGVFQVALASYVFFSPERQTSAPAAAAAFATLLLPYSVVGPFAGVLLDRWSRRQILFAANAIRVLLLTWIAVLIAAEIANALFFLSVLVTLSVNRFLLAGLSAALPHTVPRRELVMANAVSPTSGTLAFLVGGAIGYAVRGLDVGAVDADVMVVFCAAALYAVAALLALRIGRADLGPDFDPDRPGTRQAVRHVASGFVDGARYVRCRPEAAAALATIAVQRFGYGVATISTVLLYRNDLYDPADVDAGLAGLVRAVAVTGAGVLLAALVTPIVTRRMSKHRWMILLIGLGAVLSVFPAGLYTEPAILVSAFGLGVVAQGVKICVDTIVQESIEDAYRGRVFSMYDVLFNVSFVSAATFAAVALPPSGRSYVVIAVVAMTYAAAAVGYARVTRARQPSPHPEERSRETGPGVLHGGGAEAGSPATPSDRHLPMADPLPHG